MTSKESPKTVVVRPLGRVMFRGPGEFDMSSAGVKAYASSMAYPLPTAIASILISGKFRDGSRPQDYPWGDWVGEYKVLMDKLGIPTPRGPFIKISVDGGHKYYVVYDYKQQFLLGIGEKIEIPLRFMVNKLLDGRPGGLRISPENGGSPHPKLIPVSRAIREVVGINLEGGKTTGGRGEGRKRVYSAEYLFPESLFPNVGEKIVNQVTVEYRYLVPSEIENLDPIVTRIGGEGGQARVDLSSEDYVEMRLSSWGGDWLGLYVLSPILIPTDKDMHKYILDEIKDRLYLSHGSLREIYIIGETVLLNAGFALKRGNRHRSRRPIYRALKPGSLIYFRLDFSVDKRRIEQKIDEEKVEKLIWEGIGVGREIGFGSVIPFNYEMETHEEVLETWKIE